MEEIDIVIGGSLLDCGHVVSIYGLSALKCVVDVHLRIASNEDRFEPVATNWVKVKPLVIVENVPYL